LAAIDRYITIIYTINYLGILKAGYFFTKKHRDGLNETTDYDFILLSKTCQSHFETKAANVWEFTQKSELNLNDTEVFLQACVDVF